MSIPEVFVEANFIAEAFDIAYRTVHEWAKEGRIEKRGKNEYGVKSAIAYWRERNGNKGRLLEAQIRKLEAEAKLKEIDVSEREGSLIAKEKAAEEIEEVLTKVRVKITGFPSRLALELSGLNDPRQCEDRLEEVCREILEELYLEL